MKKIRISYIVAAILIPVFFACEDFLDRAPLDSVSMETFWKSPEQAKMWVNKLYEVDENHVLGLIGVHITTAEAYSDNAYGRATRGKNNIANGSFDPTDGRVNDAWKYTNIRLCHEFFEYINQVPGISQQEVDELSGQVRFFLAFEYYKLITRYRDVPLITKLVTIEESDIEKSPKADVLEYLLEQVDMAIDLLPLSWPESEAGRITKGAALFLKTRVLLYNERWNEAANVAKQLMDLNIYKLHPNFDELYRVAFNNKKEGVILENQYAENLYTHYLSLRFAPVVLNAHSLILPTPQLVNAFEMKDGLPIDESPLYDPTYPFDNRDPRFYTTFLWHGQILNDTYPPLDLSGKELNYSFTYMYFRKGIVDFRDGFRLMHLNWNLFRYADLLLMYAEAKNEISGPDASVYEALDLIRERAGMPPVDRNRYNDQGSLRSFIRNERRVELAGEGLRYNDIIRWRIAEDVLNINLTSMDLSQWPDGPVDSNGDPILVPRPVETRYFDPNKHYVWPIPQQAIDQASNLTQHSEWK
jgi:starch-binding outer membrane protein, SusD/RagB family